jgi:hypothetical protein
MRSLATRPNSRTLWVTRISPRASACVAINASKGPLPRQRGVDPTGDAGVFAREVERRRDREELVDRLQVLAHAPAAPCAAIEFLRDQRGRR